MQETYVNFPGKSRLCLYYFSEYFVELSKRKTIILISRQSEVSGSCEKTIEVRDSIWVFGKITITILVIEESYFDCFHCLQEMYKSTWKWNEKRHFKILNHLFLLLKSRSTILCGSIRTHWRSRIFICVISLREQHHTKSQENIFSPTFYAYSHSIYFLSTGAVELDDRKAMKTSKF